LSNEITSRMDRATFQNLLLFGSQGAAGQGALDDPNGEAQGSQQVFASSYPALMQHYLQQQQLAAAVMDPRLTGLAGGLSYPVSQATILPNRQGLQQHGSLVMDVNRLQYIRAAQQQQGSDWIGDMSGEGDPYAESGILGPWSATSAGLLGKMASNNKADSKGKKSRKKPKDRPKRPLSAYNIFFKEERQRILSKIPDSDVKEEGDGKTAGAKNKQSLKRKKSPHGKIGFENLAKVIGQRWQDLKPDEVQYYKEKAEADMDRYKEQMEEYLNKKDSNGKGAGEASEDLEAEEKPTKKAKVEDE